MKISQNQIDILKSLKCQRLKDDEKNMYLVEEFSNSINDDIAQTLRNEAFKEDESNSVAYYVVKHPNGQILFFFSLIRASKGITKDDLHKLHLLKLDILEELEKEISNKEIARVGSTFSGIELVHFCSNTDTDDLWANLELPQLRGTTIFWFFVVPMVLETLKYVGCQYLFLFAADRSKDEKLVRYYEDQLNLNRPDDLATAKPFYDFTCKFMCHEISSLEKEQAEFFANFNPSHDNV